MFKIAHMSKVCISDNAGSNSYGSGDGIKMIYDIF